MITTFYGPVYLLARVCWKQIESTAKQTKKTKIFRKTSADCFPETFVGIAHQLLRIFLVFGMVLPVPVSRGNTFLGFYRLMVPGNDERKMYSKITWTTESSTPDTEQRSGWSNIPILMVLFSYLVKVNVIKLDPAFLDFFLTRQKTPEVDIYDKGPHFMVGVACLTLLDLTSLVMYGETHSGVEVSSHDKIKLFSEIQKHFNEASKKWLYENMANYFTKDFPETLRKNPPKETSQPKAKPLPTTKNRGEPKRKIDESLSTKQEKSTPKKPKTTIQPSTKSKATKPTSQSHRDDKAPAGGEESEESEDIPILSLVAKKPEKPSGVGDDKSTSSFESGHTVPYHSRKTDSDILQADRQEPAQLEQTVEEIATATTEPDVQVDVLKFHPSRPPKYINTKFTSWYWTLQDVKHSEIWTYIVATDDIDNRIRENVINIIVTEVAIEYSKIKQATEGNELLNIMAEPFNTVNRPYWPADEERKKWHAMLIELDDYVTKLTENGGTIPKSLDAPDQDTQAFCDYFANFVANKINEKPASRKDEEGKNAPVEDTKVVPFWNRSKVSNMAEFNLDSVQAMIHKWRCCILYDTMCRSHFRGVYHKRHLSDALFGNLEATHLFPSTHLKEEWEGTFNMLVYHLQDYEIHSRNDNWMDPENVKPGFFESLIKTTGRMLEMALIAGETTQADVVMGEEPSITTDETAVVPASKPRPTLCEAVVKDLVVYDELCGLFFHHDGHLRQDLTSSVNWDAPHGFTSFGNCLQVVEA